MSVSVSVDVGVGVQRTPSTGLRHPSFNTLEVGARKRCSECESGTGLTYLTAQVCDRTARVVYSGS